MKTITANMLAKVIILAAIIIATTNPSIAQRRQSQNTRTESRVERSENNRRNTVQNKSSNKTSRSVQNKKARVTNSTPKSQSATVKSNRGNSRNPVRQASPTVNNSNINRRSSGAVRSQQRNNVQNSKSSAINQSRNSNNREISKGNSRSQTRTSSSAVNSNAPRRNTTANTANSIVRNRSTSNRDFYNHNNDDVRYRPNSNYRGNNRVWSGNVRPKNMNYNNRDRNFYRNFNYRKYSYWDRNWERFRWNRNSWMDYYSGYNPYSYRFHKFYYHHPTYGHVIRKFVYRPEYFIYNNVRYYDYDGHFFRFVRGVGYVLVDMPFGIVFQGIPRDFERVHVNGYLYLRIGNMFFEYTDYGFRLVHYPERYYSYNDSYINEGFYFEDYY